MHSSIYPSIHPSIHSFIHSLVHAFHPSIHPFIHAFIYRLTDVRAEVRVITERLSRRPSRLEEPRDNQLHHGRHPIPRHPLGERLRPQDQSQGQQDQGHTPLRGRRGQRARLGRWRPCTGRKQARSTGGELLRHKETQQFRGRQI